MVMKKKASLFQNWLVKTLTHLCPDILDGILAVMLMVSLAPTDVMVAQDTDQVMDMGDTPVVGIEVPTNIVEPTNPAQIMEIIRKKLVKLSTENNAAMNKNENVNKFTKL